VHPVVVERAARVPAGIATPHQRVGIEIHHLPLDLHDARRVDPHQGRLADRARVEQLLGLQDGRVIEEVLGHAERRARAGHRRGDAIGLGHRDRQRLLRRDVLAGG
jgi:hypothetical protein